MIEKLKNLKKTFDDIEAELGLGEVFKDQSRYKTLSKKRSELEEVVEGFNHYLKIEKDIENNEEIIKAGEDPDLVEMAEEELEPLREKSEAIWQSLKVMLLPQDPNDSKNTIIEIRAGTGGDEAGLFCADLYRMYIRYSEEKGWRHEVLSSSETGVGGFKEIIFLVTGNEVYAHLKYEAGVHRVQRVPETEAQGRVHTSAATVAILPEMEAHETIVDEKDLQFDVYRSSGPGGQSVNTTDSAVRATHIPTGIVVCCQDEKSQHKNKAKAIKIISARVAQLEEEKLHQERATERKAMVGSGDRSERIRTYNFPQNRLTDHRIGLTLHRLDQVVQGDLTEVVDSLRQYYQLEALKYIGDNN